MVRVLMYADKIRIILAGFLVVGSVFAGNKEPKSLHLPGVPGKIFYETL
jgi:hypothetical protein